MPFRPSIARQILALAYGGATTITPADVESMLRRVVRDPVEAEEKIGLFYGGLFKRKESTYDARGGRR